MNWKTSRRMIRRLGLALAVTAFAAPAAQAMPAISDDGAVAAGPQAPVIHVVSSMPTDSLGRPLTPPEPTDSLGRPLTPPEPTDSLGRPLSPPDLAQPASDVVSDSSSFDWAHIGVGFFALGLMLVAGGALIISRQNHRSRLAAP